SSPFPVEPTTSSRPIPLAKRPSRRRRRIAGFTSTARSRAEMPGTVFRTGGDDAPVIATRPARATDMLSARAERRADRAKAEAGGGGGGGDVGDMGTPGAKGAYACE